MSILQIQTDMQYLAGRLEHRGANTANERLAAEYIRDRFRQYTPHADMDDFYCPDTPWYLFASYYAEFTVVSLLAIWFPRVALCYGAAVFLAYLAEYSGFRVMGRFIPQYESQNVVARFLGTRPERQFFVMAHYDSGRTGPLSRPEPGMSLWAVQMAVILCMIVVLATCGVVAIKPCDDEALRLLTAIRWTAAVCLLGAAAATAFNELSSEHSRGANDNASGVAALLSLAERFATEPIPNVDVYLVATGSNQAWMSGARQLVKSHRLDKATSFFVNLDRVGIGQLNYTKSVGMLHMYRCSYEIASAARKESVLHDAVPCRLRTACSDILIPLTRGFHAMEITRGPAAGDMVSEEVRLMDRLAEVDWGNVSKAAGFAEAVLRTLAKD